MKPNQIVLFAGLFLSSLTFPSCQKEDVLPRAPVNEVPGTPTTPSNPTTPTTPTTPEPPVTNNSLVKQFGFETYRYDEQKRLVEVAYLNDLPQGYTITYQGNKAQRMNFKSGHYLLYTYEGDKVVKAKHFDAQHAIQFDHTFAYSGDLLVKKTTITYAGIPNGHLAIIDYKYDAQGNLTEQVITWSPSNSPEDMRGPKSIYWGNYDSKINPMPFIDTFLYLPGVKVSTNNPGFRDPGINKQFFTYTYHESGMPKERTFTLEGHPDFQPYTEKFTY